LARWILDRDGYVCWWCGGHATTVDHLIARVDGGDDAPGNLVASCGPCNYARGAAHTNRRPTPSRRW
jgi:5-methylcytosine-specific restriction endonuclease McrA